MEGDQHAKLPGRSCEESQPSVSVNSCCSPNLFELNCPVARVETVETRSAIEPKLRLVNQSRVLTVECDLTMIPFRSRRFDRAEAWLEFRFQQSRSEYQGTSIVNRDHAMEDLVESSLPILCGCSLLPRRV
jgi:hypothetical protein